MYDHKKIAAILLAAGMGKRMQAGINKVWLKLGDQSVLARSLQVFQDTPEIDLVVMAAPADEFPRFASFLDERKDTFRVPVYLTAGGKERQDSVANGLEYLKGCREFDPDQGLVLIHDAARALVTRDLISRSVVAADQFKAAGVGVRVKDTIKVVNPDGLIIDTPDRSTLWAIQTPQAFEYRLLSECYQVVAGSGKLFSDDCGVVEQCGYPVRMIEGSYDNIKITTPEDMEIAASILRRQTNADRSGI